MYNGILARGAMAGAALIAANTAYAQNSNFIGLGVGVVPVYQGASDYRVTPVPLINYHAGSFFVTPRGGLPALGFKASLAPNLDAGVFIGVNRGRDSDKADRTRGLDDIKFHGTYGAFVEWTPGRYSLGAAYRQAARGGYGGTLDLRASYAAVKTANHLVRVGVNTEWANEDAMHTWYGVTPAQAARSQAGLSVYSPSAGFKSAALFANWQYRINSSWSTMTTIGVNTLLGDARDSPLTERKTNVFGAVGIVYHF